MNSNRESNKKTVAIIYKTKKPLKMRNAPQKSIVYKRSCNQTPLVNSDITKKTTFYEK